MGVKIEFNKVQKKEIKKKLQKIEKKKKDIKAYKRIQALRLRSIGKTNAEISEIIGFNAQYITDLVRKYVAEGIESIVTDKRTSNYRRMSYAEETEFLEQFVELAESGQILTVDEIKKKFDEVTGKESHVNTIYCLLKRHGWRKVRPRPTNPKKASEEEIETAKKRLVPHGSKSCWTNTSRTAEQAMKK
jgi:transposase